MSKRTYPFKEYGPATASWHGRIRCEYSSVERIKAKARWGYITGYEPKSGPNVDLNVTVYRLAYEYE